MGGYFQGVGEVVVEGQQLIFVVGCEIVGDDQFDVVLGMFVVVGSEFVEVLQMIFQFGVY